MKQGELRIYAQFSIKQDNPEFLIEWKNGDISEQVKCVECGCEYFVWDKGRAFSEALKTQPLLINGTTTAEFKYYCCEECYSEIPEEIKPLQGEVITYTFHSKNSIHMTVKATELRIGNIVHINEGNREKGDVMVCREVHNTFSGQRNPMTNKIESGIILNRERGQRDIVESCIHGVPITEDLLLELGARKQLNDPEEKESPYFFFKYENKYNSTVCLRHDVFTDGRFYNGYVPVDYLHQLQNIFFVESGWQELQIPDQMIDSK